MERKKVNLSIADAVEEVFRQARETSIIKRVRAEIVKRTLKPEEIQGANVIPVDFQNRRRIR